MLAKRWIPGLAFVFGLGLAPAAAQSASGTMVPVAATAAKPARLKFPKADEFKTVAAAAAHCPGDTVVWSSFSRSNSFHLPGSTHYGTTKHGAYVCEKEALGLGFHAAKS